MKIQRLRVAAALPLIASLTLVSIGLVGCDKDNSRPSSAMPIQSTPAPPKSPPSSAEEKIQAIQNAPISPKEKEEAIARVRSGKL